MVYLFEFHTSIICISYDLQMCCIFYSMTGIVAGNDVNSLIPRQVVENVQSVLGAVASVAIDYPMGK